VSLPSSPAPRFRNRCRWNQDADSKRKCKGSVTVLQRNGGVCESCQSLRARWAARLVAEFPSTMSRSQLNTLLDKYMDLNRCRQILEERKAGSALSTYSAYGAGATGGDSQVTQLSQLSQLSILPPAMLPQSHTSTLDDAHEESARLVATRDDATSTAVQNELPQSEAAPSPPHPPRTHLLQVAKSGIGSILRSLDSYAQVTY